MVPDHPVGNKVWHRRPSAPKREATHGVILAAALAEGTAILIPQKEGHFVLALLIFFFSRNPHFALEQRLDLSKSFSPSTSGKGGHSYQCCPQFMDILNSVLSKVENLIKKKSKNRKKLNLALGQALSTFLAGFSSFLSPWSGISSGFPIGACLTLSSLTHFISMDYKQQLRTKTLQASDSQRASPPCGRPGW